MLFDGDRTRADAFIRELRIYMMANQGVPGFESPIRRIAIALTFIKGPQVDGWVEGILEGLEQLHPIHDNIEYVYTNFLARFESGHPLVSHHVDSEFSDEGVSSGPVAVEE